MTREQEVRTTVPFSYTLEMLVGAVSGLTENTFVAYLGEM